jgi:hypothetical protein
MLQVTVFAVYLEEICNKKMLIFRWNSYKMSSRLKETDVDEAPGSGSAFRPPAKRKVTEKRLQRHV